MSITQSLPAITRMSFTRMSFSTTITVAPDSTSRASNKPRGGCWRFVRDRAGRWTDRFSNRAPLTTLFATVLPSWRDALRCYRSREIPDRPHPIAVDGISVRAIDRPVRVRNARPPLRQNSPGAPLFPFQTRRGRRLRP